MNYKSYEEYFKNLGISEKEANCLLDYLSSLAEIGIKFVNEHKIEYYEKYCANTNRINFWHSNKATQ